MTVPKSRRYAVAILSHEEVAQAYRLSGDDGNDAARREFLRRLVLERMEHTSMVERTIDVAGNRIAEIVARSIETALRQAADDGYQRGRDAAREDILHAINGDGDLHENWHPHCPGCNCSIDDES